MPGQHCAAIFADALVKGHRGFDVAKAYEVLRTGAFDGLGRQGGEKYLKLGYLPGSEDGAVSTAVDYAYDDWYVARMARFLNLKLGYTPGMKSSVSIALDYAYDDWCVAQMARLLNHFEDATTLMERSQNYRKLWDPSVGFMREKKEDGTWVEPFDEFKWQGPYCESGPWQASWFVPHDPAGLTGLLGGREQFAAKLDKLFALSLPPGHKTWIHEEAEMAAIPFGQCALNNQPSFGIPYLYAAIGLPSKTQYWTRRACAELFNAGPKGFCGDEDNGSMASWYLLSASGLYPFCPGTAEYLVTSPAFPKAVIHLAGDKTLIITASANSDKNVYIQKWLFNGKTETKTWISHQDITGGGELQFEMGPTPKPDSVGDKDMPYSASNEK
jgi:predicted alpha-1,2-mannosidase